MAGTSNSSTVPAGGSGLDPLIQLAQLLGGTKTTQTGTADVSAIGALLPQLLQSPDAAKQIAALFSAAGAQIPGLAASRSNAVGARTGNNSGIQSAMDKLLQDTVLKAQGQIAQQEAQRQATAGNVAVGLANATRGSNTQAGTNIQKATGILGLLGGVEKFGNSRMGKKAMDIGGDALNSIQNYFVGPDGDQVFGGSQLLANAGDNIDPTLLTGGDVLSSGVDFSNAFSSGDTASTVSDASTAYDAGSAISDSSMFEDVIPWDLGFKDGGLIGRDNKPASKKKMSAYKPKGYADGGEVRQSSAGGRISSAPTYIPELIQRSVAKNSNPLMAGFGFSDDSNIQGSIGVSDSTAPASQDGPPSIGQAVAMGQIAMALASQNPIALVSAINNMMNASNNAASAASNIGQTSDEGISVNTDGALSSAPTNGSLTGPMGQAIADANAAAAAAGSGGMGVGGNSGESQGEGAAPGDAGGGVGDGVGSGGDSGPGEADGGKISGKGSGTSDQIPIRVSNGEYVVPADVVEHLGVSFFDNLRAHFHTPAFMQAADTDDSNGDDIG